MARAHAFRTWDDYYIPGTYVLRNKFTGPGKPNGEPDADRLRTMEEGAASFRLLELTSRPIAGRFDYDVIVSVPFVEVCHHLFKRFGRLAGRFGVFRFGAEFFQQSAEREKSAAPYRQV